MEQHIKVNNASSLLVWITNYVDVLNSLPSSDTFRILQVYTGTIRLLKKSVKLFTNILAKILEFTLSKRYVLKIINVTLVAIFSNQTYSCEFWYLPAKCSFHKSDIYWPCSNQSKGIDLPHMQLCITGTLSDFCSTTLCLHCQGSQLTDEVIITIYCTIKDTTCTEEWSTTEQLLY